MVVEEFVSRERAPEDVRYCTPAMMILLIWELIDHSSHGNANLLRNDRAKILVAAFILANDWNGRAIHAMQRRDFGRELQRGVGIRATNGVFTGLHDHIEQC